MEIVHSWKVSGIKFLINSFNFLLWRVLAVEMGLRKEDMISDLVNYFQSLCFDSL